MDQHQKTNAGNNKMVAGIIIGIVVALALCIPVFSIAKSHDAKNGGPQTAATLGGSPTTTTGESSASCSGNQQKMNLNIGGQTIQSCGVPTVGTVTAVSATSLTVKTDSGTKTFVASDATKVINGDSTDTMSAIKTNDKVIAIPSSDDPDRVDYVLLNPDIQSSGGGMVTGSN